MSYSMKFEMCANPWNAAVIIFDDGATKLHKHRLRPDTPVLVQVEGVELTAEQIEVCRKPVIYQLRPSYLPRPSAPPRRWCASYPAAA